MKGCVMVYSDVLRELKDFNLKTKDLETYKKFIKDYKGLTEENKIELFFYEIVDYINKQYNENALQALDKIIVRFEKDDFQKVLKGYKDEKHLGIFGEIFYKKRISSKNVKEALDALKIDINNYELNELVGHWLWCKGRKNEDTQQAIKRALDGKDKIVLQAIKHFIGTKYYEQFYCNMEFVINEVIESFINIDEIKNKISEFINEKEQQLKKIIEALKRMTKELNSINDFF